MERNSPDEAGRTTGDAERGFEFNCASFGVLLPAARKSFVTSGLAIAVVALLFMWNDPHGTGVWVALRISVSVLCYLILGRFVREPQAYADSVLPVSLVMGASGVVWGLLPAFIWPGGPEWEALIVLCLFGNQSVVTAVCSTDRSVYRVAIGSVTLVGGLSMLVRADSFSLVLAALVALGGVYSLAVFSAIHPATVGAIDARLRADELSLSLGERQRELQAVNAALEELAFNDVMTRLPNRRGFIASVVDPDRCLRGDGWLGIADLDCFKRINDTWGHLVGDEVLIEAARRWVIALDGAYIARTGGDEFSFVVADGADVERLTAAMVSSLDTAMKTSASEPVGVSCSIGVTRFERGESLSSAMARADAALYESKKSTSRRVILSADSQPFAGQQPVAAAAS